MEKIIQRAAVADTLNRLMFAVDRRDFKLAIQQLADEVTLDYTSLFGGVPQRLASEVVIEQWSGVFQRLRTTQHTLSNLLVDVTKDYAVSTSYVQALHNLPYTDGGSTWMLYGYYEHELVKTTDGWKITSMKLIATHQEGNTSLLGAAASEPIIRSVSFSSEGASLSGLLFLPAGYRGDVKLPAVIVTGSWTTVKEQMPTLYAGLMARKGFAAFVFDFRGFGQSEGEPRQLESYRKKIEDIKNAITALEALPEVDADRIGGLGICASCGYMALTAAQDSRLKSLAMVAPWLHDQTLVELIYGGNAGVEARLMEAEKAITVWKERGVPTLVPACSATDEHAAMFGEWDYYLNPKRGAIAAWKNKFNVMSWKEWLTFDPIQIASRIHVPVLLVHSESAAIPQGAKAFYQDLPGDKKMVWTDGSQFDFYDSEKQVLFSVKEVVNWLSNKL